MHLLIILIRSFSSLNLSLVWLEIALNLSKMSSIPSQNVRHYRTVFIIYYLLFFSLMCYFIAIGKLGTISYLAIGSSFYIAVTYGLAYFRIRPISKIKMIQESPFSLLLGRIMRTALAIFVIFILAIVLQATHFLVHIYFPDTPCSSPSEFPLHLFWLDLCLLCGTIGWFLHRLTLDKLRGLKLNSKKTNQESKIENNYSKPGCLGKDEIEINKLAQI